MVPGSLAIIGSAGRREPIERSHWRMMLGCARELAGELGVTRLVSGGAAGADHVAVRLFLDGLLPLTLELGADWDFEALSYVESGSGNWMTDPGRTLNRHHRAFQESAGVESFEDLQLALRACEWRAHRSGLWGRNTVVANADVLLAMTFGAGRQMAQGGTADTCRKYRRRGGESIYHLDLHTGRLYPDAAVPR